jgi:hypothetical protein
VSVSFPNPDGFLSISVFLQGVVWLELLSIVCKMPWPTVIHKRWQTVSKEYWLTVVFVSSFFACSSSPARSCRCSCDSPRRSLKLSAVLWETWRKLGEPARTAS